MTKSALNKHNDKMHAVITKETIHQQQKINLIKFNRKLLNDSCIKDAECEDILNSICLEGRCNCIINHQAKDKLHCEPIKCKNNSDCKLWDQRLICNLLGDCVCPDNYQYNEFNRKCHRQISSKISNWFILIAFFPLIIIIGFYIYCTRLALSSKRQINHQIMN